MFGPRRSKLVKQAALVAAGMAAAAILPPSINPVVLVKQAWASLTTPKAGR